MMEKLNLYSQYPASAGIPSSPAEAWVERRHVGFLAWIRPVAGVRLASCLPPGR